MQYRSSAHRSLTGSLAAAIAGLALASAATPASAGTFNVGPETVVRHLHDVRLQNGSGEPLYLGYTITYHWFGLPYGVSRGGYVLAVKDKAIQYELEEARVGEWQAQGHVPSPLPVYRMSTADYVLGNLLWIVAGLLGVWYGGKALLFCRKAKSAAPQVDQATKAAAAAMAQRAALVSRPAQAKPAAESTPAVAVSAPAAMPTRDARIHKQPEVQAPQPDPRPQTQERPKVQELIQTLKQPAPRPFSQQAAQLSQTMVTAMRLPVARTLCRVKALKVA